MLSTDVQISVCAITFGCIRENVLPPKIAVTDHDD